MTSQVAIITVCQVCLDQCHVTMLSVRSTDQKQRTCPTFFLSRGPKSLLHFLLTGACGLLAAMLDFRLCLPALF